MHSAICYSVGILLSESDDLLVTLFSELDEKWYKFDFEHVLPRRLLASSQDTNCKVSYQCSGVISQAHNGAQIQSFNTPFIVDAAVQASQIPRHLLQPITKYTVKHFNPNCGGADNSQRSSKSSNNQIAVDENQCQKNGSLSSGESRPSVDADVCSIAGDDWCCPLPHNLVSTLWLSKQLLIPGKYLDLQLNIDNATDVSCQARLILFQASRPIITNHQHA